MLNGRGRLFEQTILWALSINRRPIAGPPTRPPHTPQGIMHSPWRQNFLFIRIHSKFRIVVSFFLNSEKIRDDPAITVEGENRISIGRGQIFYVIWDCHRDYYRQIEYAGSVSRLSSCFFWPELLYWMLRGEYLIYYFDFYFKNCKGFLISLGATREPILKGSLTLQWFLLFSVATSGPFSLEYKWLVVLIYIL